MVIGMQRRSIPVQTPSMQLFRSLLETVEYALHRLNPLNIGVGLVVPAALAVGQLESPSRKLIARPRAAQMDQGGERLLMRERRSCGPVALENQGDAAIQIRGGQLDRITGKNPRIEAVEPTGMPIVPRPVGNDSMIVDAIAAGLGKVAVGNLVHADRARCGTIDLKGLSRPRPAPIGSGNRIPGTFNLRDGSKEIGLHHAGRVFLEQRPVLPPGFGGGLIKSAAYRKKQLRGLAGDLIDEVDGEPKNQDDQRRHYDFCGTRRRAPPAPRTAPRRAETP